MCKALLFELNVSPHYFYIYLWLILTKDIMVLKENEMWMSVFCDITMSTMIILLIQSWTKQSGKSKGTFFVREFISSVKIYKFPHPTPQKKKRKSPKSMWFALRCLAWYIMQYLSRHNNQHKEVSRVSALLGLWSR